MEQKKFCAVLENFGRDPQGARESLGDKRFTRAERIIVESYLLLRKNENTQVLLNLLDLTDRLPEFVEAHKDLLHGIVLNNLSQFQNAVPHFSRALQIFHRRGLGYFEFITLLNLFFVHNNLGDKKQMKSYLDKLKALALTRPEDVVRALTCRLSYFSQMGELGLAEETAEELSLLREHMNEHTLVTYFIELFDLHVKKEDFRGAKAVLEELKDLKSFKLSSNFKYMRKLLDHFTKDTPLYIMDSDFEIYPSLLYQVKVLQKLEEGNREEALGWWMQLHEKWPDVYQKNFTYSGGKNIFSLCLDKHASVIKTSQVLTVIGYEGGNILRKLQIVFKKAQAPIKKEDLYKMLWGCAPDNKADLMKLTRAIYRLEKKYGIEVRSRKGTYFVDKKEKKSA